MFLPSTSGTTLVDAFTPTIRLDGVSGYFVGDTLYKIGQVTGWTGGVLRETDRAIMGNDGLWRLESGIVEGGADEGDSGAPVIKREVAGNYGIAGFLWGRATITEADGSSTRTFLLSWWYSVNSELSYAWSLKIVNR